MNSKERHEARYQRRKQARYEKKMEKYLHCLNFNDVFTYDNLYKTYLKSRKNVSWKASVQKYIVNAPLNVYLTQQQLMNDKFKSDGFYEFDLYERGKLRHIKSVTIKERIVQKCLCDYALTPIIGRKLIYDNGASQKHKGPDFAKRRVIRHLQYYYRKHGTNDGYILLFDFSKFFDNISHELIKKILAKEFDDERILKLTYHFIDAFGDKGMGLGSQISQVLALVTANKIDHYVKQTLLIKEYGRYNDDEYIIHENKEYLKEVLKKIRLLCDELGIKLNEKKTQIVKLSHGFKYLKTKFYLLSSGKIVKKMCRQSITRQRVKLKKFRRKVDDKKMSYNDVYASFQSWKSHAKKYDAYFTIKNMGKLYDDLFINRVREEDYVL